MGLMESLSLGLRGAGGVLSPGAFQVGAQEDLQTAQQRRQEALMQLQDQMAQVKEQALAQAVGPALATGNFEEAAKAAAQSGAPGGTRLALDLLSKAEERKQRALQFLQQQDLRQQALDQQKELALQRAQDQRERDAISAAFKERTTALAEQNSRIMEGLKQQGLDIQRDRQKQQEQQQLNLNVQKLGGALEKANLPEADAVLGAVESALDKSPNLANYISGPGSLLPDMALPNDIASGRQAFQKLFNITLKNRSGAAVTIPEFERLKAEFGSGAFKTPAQLRNAVEQARSIINKHYASVASGFGPDVLDAYNANVRGFGGRVVLRGSESKADTADPLGIR